MTITTDPLETIWHALEARDCHPRGKPYDFRARCPGHGGDSAQALHVCEGSDRRVIMHCFSHRCPAERIVQALGLQIGDLFPPGHRRSRRVTANPVHRSDLTGSAQVVANTLGALDKIGQPWQAMVMTDCPFCLSPGAWLCTTSTGPTDVDCPTGCGAHEFTQAIAYRLAA